MKPAFYYALSAALIAVIWESAATAIASPLILPHPGAVVKALCAAAATASFWQNVLATLARVFVSFFIAAAAGTATGILHGTIPAVRHILALPLAVVRATPIVSFILIAIFIFKSSAVPVIAAVLMTLPVMTESVSASLSLSEDDKKKLEMARIYRLTANQKIKYIFFPNMSRHIAAALVSSFGMTWKVVAAGEVLSVPKKALGSLLYTAQVHLESETVYATSLAIVVLSFAFEIAAKCILKKVPQ